MKKLIFSIAILMASHWIAPSLSQAVSIQLKVNNISPQLINGKAPEGSLELVYDDAKQQEITVVANLKNAVWEDSNGDGTVDSFSLKASER